MRYVFFLGTALTLLSFAQSASADDSGDLIVISAARTPVSAALSGTALTVIDRAMIDAVGLPQASDLLRLSPGIAVSQAGPLGSQTQVRIRGAEANHSLVFIDGIIANDPAASGDFRFETLSSDAIERIEVLRGPQSALWGSEAIGGVVNVTTRAPSAGTAVFAAGEAGSFRTYRVNGGLNIGNDRAGLVGQVSHTGSDGIDAFGAGGERDGFRNTAVSLKAILRPVADSEIGIVVRHSNADSNFDGFSPVTFARADTLDATKIRNTAIRAYGSVSLGNWSHGIDGQYADSANINRTAATFLNRDDARRFRVGYQTSLRLTSGAMVHSLTAAAEHEKQSFTATDRVYFGGTDQHQSRSRDSLIGEYRAVLDERYSAGVSVRRDWNNRFADTTTWRATGAAILPQGFRIHASFGEGVTDPTFTEQFGFFPGSFVGNPNLTPEQAKGYDAGIGWAQGAVSADLTWFHTDLTDEIISTFSSTTFLSGVANATGRSKRHGIEAMVDVQAAQWLRIGASYTWLKASEQRLAAGLAARELRRPRNSGALTATGDWDKLRLTASAAYVGPQQDTDFSTFTVVTQKAYTLLTLNARYRLSAALDLTGRVENAGDASYRDVVGYATPGIAAYAGVRARF